MNTTWISLPSNDITSEYCDDINLNCVRAISYYKKDSGYCIKLNFDKITDSDKNSSSYVSISREIFFTNGIDFIKTIAKIRQIIKPIEVHKHGL